MLITDIIQENWRKNIAHHSSPGMEKQIADKINRLGMYVEQFSVAGKNVTINIDPLGPQDYRTSFSVNGDFTASKQKPREGYRTTKRIFEGVLERLAAFIRAIEPNTISFSAGPEHQKAERALAKIDLYISLLRQLEPELNQLGYQVVIDPVYRPNTTSVRIDPDDINYVEFTIEKIHDSQ